MASSEESTRGKGSFGSNMRAFLVSLVKNEKVSQTASDGSENDMGCFPPSNSQAENKIQIINPSIQAAQRSILDDEETLEKEEKLYLIEYKKGSGMDRYTVNGLAIGQQIKEVFLKDVTVAPFHDLSCIWNLISQFARFDFEWRVSSPLSWDIDDNKVIRVQGALDTNDSNRYAAVTLNFDTSVVMEMELCFRLQTSDDLEDGNAIFLGVLNDRTTDSFACIGKSGFITIRTTRSQNSNADKWMEFNNGDIFGIRVKVPNEIHFRVNDTWSPMHTFNVGKLTTIYLSVRPIKFEAEVIHLKMQVNDYKIGKMPFRLRNVWPEGADRE